MTAAAFTVAWRAKGLNPIEKLTLMYIAGSAGIDVAKVDTRKLAIFLECNETRAERTIRRLVLKGWIVRAVSQHDGFVGWALNRP